VPLSKAGDGFPVSMQSVGGHRSPYVANFAVRAIGGIFGTSWGSGLEQVEGSAGVSEARGRMRGFDGVWNIAKLVCEVGSAGLPSSARKGRLLRRNSRIPGIFAGYEKNNSRLSQNDSRLGRVLYWVQLFDIADKIWLDRGPRCRNFRYFSGQREFVTEDAVEDCG
jgi:hypothetical protein